MYEEKLYRVKKKFVHNNQTYYYLMALDGDTFFLKEKEGGYDYLDYNEYLEIDKLFNLNKESFILYANDENNIYNITFKNKVNKKIPKFIKTCKMVWYKKILVPVICIPILIGTITGSIFANRQNFDNHLTPEILKNNGIVVSDRFVLYDDNVEKQMITMTPYNYLIDEVNRDDFPINSGVINKKNFKADYKRLDKDAFCKKLGIERYTYSDINQKIDELSCVDDFKNNFHDCIDIINSKDSNFDFRILGYNLDNLIVLVSLDSKYSYDYRSNSLFVPEVDNSTTYDDMKQNLMHEIYHMNNNAFDNSNNYLLSNIYSVISNNGIETFVRHDFGDTLEEYKAEVFASTMLNKKFNNKNYLLTCLYMTMYDTYFFDGKLTNYSLKDAIKLIQKKAPEFVINNFINTILYINSDERINDIGQLDAWISEFPNVLNNMAYVPSYCIYCDDISYDDITYRTIHFFNLFNSRFDVKTIELDDGDGKTELKYFNYRDKAVTKRVIEGDYVERIEYEYLSEPYEDCFYPEIEHQNLIDKINAFKSDESISK